MALLDVKNLTKNFGGLTAVGDVTLELNEGELVGLIGPNGAGKTTLFNLLTGVYEPSEGSVELDGTLLNGKTPYKIASLGLSRTFQNIRLFKNMTVIENVLVGMENSRSKSRIVAVLIICPSGSMTLTSEKSFSAINRQERHCPQGRASIGLSQKRL